MSIRGKTAIVGIGELPTKKAYPGRTTFSLLTEAAKLAIEDAGLRKSDIDGLVCAGEQGFNPIELAEYMRLRPTFCEGVTLHGSSGSHSIAIAAAAIAAGYANYVVCVFGGSLDRAAGGVEYGGPTPATQRTEFENPYGPVVAANGGYALLKRRHMHEFGSTDEQFAKVAADERFNAQANPNAVFHGEPATTQDILDSRWIADPLHLLECVMRCAGAMALVVTTADRAKTMPHRPVYLLGAGASATDHDSPWQSPRLTTTPTAVTSRKAFEMAGYGAKDVQFAEFYD